MKLFTPLWNFIFRFLITPICGLLNADHHQPENSAQQPTATAVFGPNETGRDSPLENTAQVGIHGSEEHPNADAEANDLRRLQSGATAGDHSNLTLDVVQEQPQTNTPGFRVPSEHLVSIETEAATPRRHAQSDATTASGELSSTGQQSNISLGAEPQPANVAGGTHHEHIPHESPHRSTGRNQAPNDDNDRLEGWLYLIIGTVLTAIGIGVQALQTIKDVPRLHESLRFHFFLMALVISLAYLTMSVFVRRYSATAAPIMVKAAVLFGFLAFVSVITNFDFPPEVFTVSSAIFVVSLLIVFLLFRNRRRVPSS